MMNFEMFKRVIDQIEANEAHDDRITEALGVEGFTTVFHESNETLVAVLEEVMGDVEEWITYYLWELNYGRDYKPGHVTLNGVDTPLANVQDLYNLLTRKK